MGNNILTVEQIEEIIAGNISPSTRVAEIKYFVAELKRREKSAQNAGRPKTSPLSRAEQNREAQKRWRERQKASQSKNADNPVLE